MRSYEETGLLYFDGHTDLNTPATSASGILDSMGVAHMIGEPGTADELSHIGSRFPLLPANKIVLFGYNQNEINEIEHGVLARHGLIHYPLANIQRSVCIAAARALSQIEQRSERFILHFDVDAIDFTDFPIADVPQFSGGLSLRDALACLSVFASSPKFSALTIAEVNPDHMDEEGVLAARFVSDLADVLAEKH